VVPVSPTVALGLLLGLALGVGLWLVVGTLPRLSRPTLESRIAPYVIDVSEEARRVVDRRTADPLPVFGLVLAPITGALIRVLDAVLGGRESAARRLRQAGDASSVEAFRMRELIWGVGGLVVGVLADIGVAQRATLSPIVHVVVVLVFVVGGVVARDRLLQRAATARLARMAEELPSILEFLTLSLAAGESILDSVRRISRISRGELATELSTVVGEVAAGVPLAEALQRLADTLDLVPFSRCVDQIVGALDRGTPIVEVLRAQAGDVREDAKRALLEAAGKKEVAMLVPLVFLILPVTVLFAIFPATLVLQMGF
jgi:tight adherence protein C